MRRISRIFVAFACFAAFSSFEVSAARASAFTNVFNDYKTHGSVSPCKHSTGELQKAKSQVPPDIDQYAPDFPAAIDAALQARARGACGGAPASAAPAPAPSTPAAGLPAATAAGAAPPGATPAPAPVTTAPSDPALAGLVSARRAASVSDAPAPLLVIAILLFAVAVPALGLYLARLRGWEPRFWPQARHAVGEAGWRGASLWSEFADWVRVGS